MAALSLSIYPSIHPSIYLSIYLLFKCISLYVVFKSFLSVNCSFHQGQLDPPKRSETALKPQKFNTCRATSQYYFPVLLCTTKLAQTTSQYYCVLQSLHKALPSTTVYYKACTKHFPVLLCTTKLAQTTSQYYCVLQSLHKALPSTTLHYKACTKHFPVGSHFSVLLCITGPLGGKFTPTNRTSL